MHNDHWHPHYNNSSDAMTQCAPTHTAIPLALTAISCTTAGWHSSCMWVYPHKILHCHLKHSAILMISLERFDCHQEFLFSSSLFLAAIYHDHKTVSVTKFHQIMHISHDIACAAGEGFRPSGDLSSYVNNCHIHHVHIHNSFNLSLPLTVCIALTFLAMHLCGCSL